MSSRWQDEAVSLFTLLLFLRFIYIATIYGVPCKTAMTSTLPALAPPSSVSPSALPPPLPPSAPSGSGATSASPALVPPACSPQHAPPFPGNGLSILSFFADDGSSLEIKRRLDPYGSSQEEIEKKHDGEVGTGQATLLRFGHGA